MTELVAPHGGRQLRPLAVDETVARELRRSAARLPQVALDSRTRGDLIMLGIGGYTPLTGFMHYADWRSVCDDLRLCDGLFWPIPITLATDPGTASRLEIGADAALVDAATRAPLALMTIVEKYAIDKLHECRTVYRTTDIRHPGVQAVLAQGEVHLAGPVRVIDDGGFKARWGDLFQTPAETRAAFAARGWSRVAAFQTRNPMHRAHEYLAKLAIEVCDGVLVHSLLGQLKPGDIPAAVRTRAIDVLLELYFRPDTVMHAGYPLDMRYAGPREALLHALFRQNFGCAYQILGRDHAGVGDFYGPYDAQRIFDEIPPDALAIKPLRIDRTFWCHACGSMASDRTCPHAESARLAVSGTQLRAWLAGGQPVPAEFSRPQVLDILREYYVANEHVQTAAATGRIAHGG
jgi:sulfate adenylyltransferase